MLAKFLFLLMLNFSANAARYLEILNKRMIGL